MLGIINPYIFGGQRGYVSSASAVSASNLTTYSFDLDLTGTWNGLIICVGNKASGNRTISSLTVNGSSWTKAGEASNNTRSSGIGAILQDGSAGTITVEFTLSGAATGAGVAVLAVSGLVSATNISAANSSTVDPVQLNFTDIGSASEFLVATSFNSASSYTGNCTWSENFGLVNGSIIEFQDDNQPDSTVSFSMSSAHCISTGVSSSIFGDWSVTGTPVGICAHYM